MAYQIGNKIHDMVNIGDVAFETKILQVFKSGGKIIRVYIEDEEKDYQTLVIETKNGGKISVQLDDPYINIVCPIRKSE